ncbi:HTH_Tnp_Tc3_2 domain-containing protein [Trichonephila clavipes]|nr:HTH_Tnp_Tc3_2 domain-containing protein [Trichonephila clavipes]
MRENLIVKKDNIPLPLAESSNPHILLFQKRQILITPGFLPFTPNPGNRRYYGKNASQWAGIANGVYGANTVTANYVQFWFRQIRSGIFDFKDAPHTGRLVVDNDNKITEIIEVDRQRCGYKSTAAGLVSSCGAARYDPDSDKDQSVAYHSKGAHADQDPLTVSRIWNRWVRDSNKEHGSGSQQFPITSSLEDRHVTRMVIMGRAALGSFTREEVSTRTVRRRLQQHGLAHRRSWRWLLLTLHH